MSVNDDILGNLRFDPGTLLRGIVRTWAPLAIVLGSITAELSTGWATGTFIGLALIILAVAIAVPVSGPIVTLISASMGALYFAYFVPEPVTSLAAAFMNLVPGFFALAPIASVLRAATEASRLPQGDLVVADQRADHALERLFRDVTTITDAGFSHNGALERIAHLPIPLLADWVVIFEIGDDGVARRIRIGAEHEAAEAALEHALQTLPRQLGGYDPLAAVSDVLRTGQPAFFERFAVQGFASTGRESGERLVLDRMEAGSLIITPMRGRGRVLGALVCARSRHKNAFRREDVNHVVEYGKRAALVLDTAQRVTAAINARARADAAHEQLRAIVDNLSNGFIALDGDGRVTQMNRAAEVMTGSPREELLGRNFWHALPPNTKESPLAQFVADAARRGATATTEASVTWTGRGRWLEIQVAPAADGASLYLRDVTEHREMAQRLRVQEEALRESQKMEVVGRLSGRLAHDFNNLLMSIAGCAELLGRKVGDNHAVREDIREILQSTERASSLTRQLMTYSRKQVHQPRLIELGGVVSDMQRRLLHVLREDIVLVVNVVDAATPVNVDPNQIEQMLLNFAVNSRDAMRQGGTFTINVSTVGLTRRRTSEHAQLPPGNYVCLEVSDTGRGIDPAVLPHVFEPFFTTKPANQGTGLGLASVYGIVRQNHGSITVNSTVGRGTTFQVLFPLASNVEVESDPEPVAELVTAPLGFIEPAEDRDPVAGVILVAEDEATVRRFVCEVLRERGYTVLEARTGIEGIAVARRHAGPIDLLLTDVIMPEMGGRDLAARILECAPDTRILFMSGYAENEIAHHGVLASGAQLLEKPFSTTTLLDRVRAVLEEPPAPVCLTIPAA